MSPTSSPATMAAGSNHGGHAAARILAAFAWFPAGGEMPSGWAKVGGGSKGSHTKRIHIHVSTTETSLASALLTLLTHVHDGSYMYGYMYGGMLPTNWSRRGQTRAAQERMRPGRTALVVPCRLHFGTRNITTA